MVDLGSYGGVGRCTCKHYQTRIEPLIRGGRKPEDAIEAGVLKLQDYHEGPWQGFHCYHISRARNALCDALVNKLLAADAAQRR